MCGIVGFVGRGNIDVLEEMMDSIKYRGPDEKGLWIDRKNKVFMGHRRLSIIDLNSGQQPMVDSTGRYVIIFNGEIYNHQELRGELFKKGYFFNTDHSDTETLLNGYAEWGENLPNLLNGMWAFSIFDKKEKKIFISRDRFGQKPLYYTFNKYNFVYGSELHSIIKHPDVTKEISIKNLKKYFAYGYIPSPNSLYQNIFKLPAGHNITYDILKNNIVFKQYWDFKIEPFEEIPDNAEFEWGEQIRDLIEKSVKRRMISDVPIGIFLSGGVDSSCITAFASEQGKKSINTFSIGFNEKSFDESRYSDQISKFFNTKHFHQNFPVEKALEMIPRVIPSLDEPMGDSSLLPTYLLSEMTREHVTVALGGDGADELFAGYDPFRAIKYAKIYDSIVPKPIHSAIKYLAYKIPVSHDNISFDFKIKRTLKGMSYQREIWNAVWLGTLSPKELSDIFNEPMDIEQVYEEAINAWDSCTQKNLIDKTLQFYTKLYLQDDILVKTDRASMLNSLEVRAPFLDIDLVNLIRKIPHQYKFKKGITKYILKKSLEPVLPNNILYRRKKGFGIPIGQWITQGKITIDNCSFMDLNQTIINKMIKEQLSYKKDERMFLWNYKLLSSGNYYD